MHICEERNVPKHLWKNNRDNIPDFEENENLYRRFKTSIPVGISVDNILTDSEARAFTGEIFQLQNDSYNRSSFCNSPEDVLYNDSGDHKPNYGIFSINANKAFFEFEAKIQEKIQKIEVSVVHDCLECNYAHAALKYKVDGITPETPRPGNTIKKLVRLNLFPEIRFIKDSTEDQ